MTVQVTTDVHHYDDGSRSREQTVIAETAAEVIALYRMLMRGLRWVRRCYSVASRGKIPAETCMACNYSKGPKDFEEWVAKLAPKHRARAVKFFEKRNGPMLQMGLSLAA